MKFLVGLLVVFLLSACRNFDPFVAPVTCDRRDIAAKLLIQIVESSESRASHEPFRISAFLRYLNLSIDSQAELHRSADGVIECSANLIFDLPRQGENTSVQIHATDAEIASSSLAGRPDRIEAGIATWRIEYQIKESPLRETTAVKNLRTAEIATFLSSLYDVATLQPRLTAQEQARTQPLYEENCAACHMSGKPDQEAAAPSFVGSYIVELGDPVVLGAMTKKCKTPPFEELPEGDRKRLAPYVTSTFGPLSQLPSRR